MLAAGFVAAAIGAVPTSAQQPASQLSRITGFAFDSVHANPLSGATIRAEGSGRSTIAREDGSFVLDSIPAGEFPIRVLHPLLDTLGLQLATRPIKFPLASEGTLTLAVPSSESVVALFCRPALRARGPSVIAGRVLDADTDSAATGAKVSIAWFEKTLMTGLKRVPNVREATVDKDGNYRICGLPTRFEGTLQGSRSGVTTAEVTIVMDGSVLALQSLRIGSAATVVAAENDSGGTTRPSQKRGEQATSGPQPLRRGQAALTGRVLNAAGQPIRGARVDVPGTASAAMTNENGEFALGGLPSGTMVLVSRQLGFAPVETPVELSTRAPQRVTVTMKDPARVLEPVLVKAEQDQGLDKVGFNRRKTGGMGYYMTTEQIEARNPSYLSDLFRAVPGIRVSTVNGNQTQIESTRGVNSCVVFYLDGSPWQSLYPGDIDQLVPPTEVAAVEIYNGSTTPVEFQQPGQSGCTSVVMWTRTRVAKFRK